MNKAATSAYNSNNYSVASKGSYQILLCSRSALWVFSISLLRMLKRYILKVLGFNPLIFFTASIITFLSETGNVW